jgi:1-pyrroline-5-carboxylate dehydrogenase
MLIDYKNEAFTNFSLPENREAMEAALKKVDGEKGKHYPITIGGEKIYTTEKNVSINPCNFNEVIGTISKGNIELAERAVAEAAMAFETWKNVNPKERANYLFNVAAILRRRKHEFSALLVEEAGKNWAEADADTAEAIDFMEYYGRQMLKLDRKSVV